MTEVNTIKEAYDQVRPFRVIIAGTRTFSDYELLKAKCDAILTNKERVEVVSGTNGNKQNGIAVQGADLLGERWAEEHGHSVRLFPADWDSYGKIAGPRRNEQMAEYADALILFWDGVSRGSKSMKKLAESYCLLVRIIRY